MLEQTTFPFPDIFSKLENHKPIEKPLEFWNKLKDSRYQSKIDGKILSEAQFQRYQYTNSYNIILEL